jgi:hypothetical protein
VPLVFLPFTFSGAAEGLAWAASGPDGAVWGPACEFESEAPTSDAGEEVALRKTFKIGCMDFGDRAFIDDAVGDQFAGDQFPEPRGGVRVEL